MQDKNTASTCVTPSMQPVARAVRRIMLGMAAGGLLCAMTGAAQARGLDTENECLRPVPGTVSAMEEICAFSQGLAAFKLGGLWGYMNREGEVQIAPQFKRAGDFSQGLAAVEQLKKRKQEDCDCESDSDGGRWGFIDAQGRWAIAAQFEGAAPFSEGLAAVQFSGKGNANVGFIDPQGRSAMSARFYRAQRFVGDKALVELSEGEQAFVTRSGQIEALPKPPESLSSDTRVEITQGRAQPLRWLADLQVPARSISMRGKVLTLTQQQRFDAPVSPEAAVISVFDSQWRKGLMHESGRWLLPPEFERLDDFENGVGIGSRKAKDKATTPSSRPAPPSLGGGNAYFVVSAEGRLLTPAYAHVRRVRGFFVARSGEEGGPAFLLGARGERLSTLSCKESSDYNLAKSVSSQEGGWSAVNTCDGQYWVQSPQGRSWSGRGKVDRMYTSRDMVLLRLDDGVQLFDSRGKAWLSSSMQAQIKNPGRVWLTVDEDSPAGQATRPLAVFFSKAEGSESAYYALTPAGRWVQLPAAHSVEWFAPRDPQERAAPVVLRTGDGMGVIDAQGRWLIKPDSKRHFFSMRGGWIGQRGQGSEPDLLWNARGQKVEVGQDVQAHVVAPGLNWLQQEGRWQLLDAQQARLTPLQGLDGAEFLQAAGGQVVMGKRESGSQPLRALYSSRGQQLSPWLPFEYLQPILDDKKTLHGWVGSRVDEAAGSYSMLLSAKGKPLTAWLPLNMRPAEGEALVFYGNAEGQRLMTPEGKVLHPALHGQVSMLKHHWVSVSEGKWKGLLDGKGHWLAVVADSKGFDALAAHNVARLGGSLDSDGALDINGRKLRLVQAPQLAQGAATLPAKKWQVTASPLPEAQRFAVNDALPENWFVQGFGHSASVRDMQGAEHLKAHADQVSVKVLPNSLERVVAVQGDDEEGSGRHQAQLLNAQAQSVAVFDDARLFANKLDRLSLQSLQPLPADHPLARPAIRQKKAEEQSDALVKDRGKPVQEEQFSLVDERSGKVLGGRFDALGELQQERASVSHMGNLGVVDAQGQLVVQSAWRCGVTPVLLSSAGEISWPPELRGEASKECSKP